MSADQAASAYSKTSSQTYKSLVKLFACVSAHSSANAFLLRWCSKSQPLPPEKP